MPRHTEPRLTGASQTACKSPPRRADQARKRGIQGSQATLDARKFERGAAFLESR